MICCSRCCLYGACMSFVSVCGPWYGVIDAVSKAKRPTHLTSLNGSRIHLNTTTKNGEPQHACLALQGKRGGWQRQMAWDNGKPKNTKTPSERCCTARHESRRYQTKTNSPVKPSCRPRNRRPEPRITLYPPPPQHHLRRPHLVQPTPELRRRPPQHPLGPERLHERPRQRGRQSNLLQRLPPRRRPRPHKQAPVDRDLKVARTIGTNMQETVCPSCERLKETHKTAASRR